MIGRIAGILLEKHPPLVLVDVGGVGYEIDVPMSTFYNLPALGEKVALHTQLIVREDAHQLYGFSTHDERAAFRQLLKISGVGPKLALTILSGMSVAELSHVVAAQEVGRLTKIPGIGKKTAERLLLELRDKLPGAAAALLSSGTEPGPAIRNDVLDALLALGYNEREASWAVKQLPANLDVSDSIRQALKFLSKA
ncbi:Holliday junction branch migration protein RuvA [Sulfuricella sp.]|uniref:Holliday junction branch migration protein RuvA n=1 Tax=Sulfuricella sp. TaxID=2099377 RepID=UPI002D01CE55|nr:Holliday junction branch migration protein RuvA [Sulfuricella sp.]HUX65060.1 Holliday junction branch migration protein RuvA [Sulfuricella sp.]